MVEQLKLNSLGLIQLLLKQYHLITQLSHVQFQLSSVILRVFQLFLEVLNVHWLSWDCGFQRGYLSLELSVLRFQILILVPKIVNNFLGIFLASKLSIKDIYGGLKTVIFNNDVSCLCTVREFETHGCSSNGLPHCWRSILFANSTALYDWFSHFSHCPLGGVRLLSIRYRNTNFCISRTLCRLDLGFSYLL